jgi:hypothetical protein
MGGLQGWTTSAPEILAPVIRGLHSYFLVSPPQFLVRPLLKWSRRAAIQSRERSLERWVKDREPAANLKFCRGLVAGFIWKPRDPGRRARAGGLAYLFFIDQFTSISRHFNRLRSALRQAEVVLSMGCAIRWRADGDPLIPVP